MVVISSKDILRHINLYYSLSAKQEQEQQLSWIRKEIIRNIEIDRYFSFQILLNMYTFIICTCNFQQNNRQQAIIQPLEEAENVVKADEIQAQGCRCSEFFSFIN
jgi:hypothetical protein